MKAVKETIRKYYKYNNAVELNIIESTESDYDFYKDVDVYKLPKRTSTKHFKTIFEQATAGEYQLDLPIGEYYVELYGAGGGYPNEAKDGYCRIMQETTAKDSESSETVHIYYGII